MPQRVQQSDCRSQSTAMTLLCFTPVIISRFALINKSAPAQNIAMAAFRRAAADGAEPWPTTVDIWYSERVVDMDADVPKWCALLRACSMFEA